MGKRSAPLKHPILTGFLFALLSCVALALVLPYKTQEAPWALMLIAAAFPFIWFLGWVALGAAAWWRDTVDPE